MSIGDFPLLFFKKSLLLLLSSPRFHSSNLVSFWRLMQATLQYSNTGISSVAILVFSLG